MKAICNKIKICNYKHLCDHSKYHTKLNDDCQNNYYGKLQKRYCGYIGEYVECVSITKERKDKIEKINGTRN